MANSLKIAIFGNDLFTFKTASTLIELLTKAGMENEYHAILPQLQTNAAKDSPIKLYTQYIKDSTIIQHKGLRADWRSMHKYFANLEPHYGVICGVPSFDPTIAKYFSQKLLLAHPSILPNFAGPDPIPHVLYSNAKTTGFTITDVASEADLYENEIIYQEEIPVGQDDTYASLANKIGENAGIELTKIIKEMEAGNTFQADKPEKPPIRCDRLPRLFSVDQADADTVIKLHKSLQGNNYPPATFMRLNSGLVLTGFLNPEVYTGTLLEKAASEPPGTLYWNFTEEEGVLLIKCKEGVIKCSGIRLMQARKQSRGTSPRYFISTHMREKGQKPPKTGKVLVLDTTKDMESFTSYKNFVDKKFQYIVPI